MSRVLYALMISIFLSSCTSNSTSDLLQKNDPEATLQLKWNKAYPDDSLDKSTIGLTWALSFVGAILPSSPYGIKNNGDMIVINLNELGFEKSALGKLQLLHQKIKLSNEYQTTNAIDLGRYVALLIGASEHYYEIVGVPRKLDDLLAHYALLPQKGYVNNSGVSLEHRIIQFSEQNNLNQVFLSAETDPITGETYEFETLEIMPNGQVRFGIFDVNGNRKNNADPAHSNAGKPAKCMWCHESTIQRLYTVQEDFLGYLTSYELQNQLLDFNQMLQNKKYALPGGVDFTQTQQHTETELLYISFMEPSAQRLSVEWQMPVSQVQNLLSDLPTHIYPEFPFLGNLYDRNAIENRAPFLGLSVSTKVREASENEVNHLN